MGLRTPQSLTAQPSQVAKSPSIRQNITAPEVSTEFLKPLEAASKAKEEQRLKDMAKLRKEQEDLLENQLDSQFNEPLYRAKAAVSTAKGANAIAVAKEQRDSLRKELDAITESAPDQFRDKARAMALKKMDSYTKVAIPKEYTEIQNLKVEASTERVNSAMDEAVEVSGNPDQFNDEGLAIASAKAIQLAELKYGDSPDAQELRDAFVESTVSQTILRAVDVQSSGGFVDKAEGLMKRFGNELRPEDKVKAQKIITQALKNGDDDQARALMKMAAQAHPDDLVKQQEFIYNNARTDIIAERSTRMANARLSAQEKQRRLNEMGNISKAYDIVQKEGEVTSEALRLTPPEKRNALLNYAIKLNKGEAIATVPDTKNRIMDKILNAPFDVKENLALINSSAGDLSIEDRRAMTTMAQKGYDALVSGKIKGGTADQRIVLGLAERFAVTQGFMEKEEIDQMQMVAIEKMYEIIDENPNMSIPDIQRRVTKFLYESAIVEEEVESEGFFGGLANIFVPGQPFKTSSKEQRSIIQPKGLEAAAPSDDPGFVDSSWDEFLKGKNISRARKLLEQAGYDLSQPRQGQRPKK